MPPDPYRYFRVEAREILDQIGKGMLDLEKDPRAPGLVQGLLRHAHTLKGAARVVKQPEIADDAHAIEDALAPFRDGAAVPARAQVDAVLALVDRIGARVSALGSPAPEAQSGEREPGAASDDAIQVLRVDVEEIDALMDGVSEAHAQLAAVRGAMGALDRVRHLQELLTDQLRAPRSGPKALSIAEELGQLLTSLEGNVGVGVEQIDRELRQVRQAAERLRLLQAGVMFNVLERTARDVARSMGKRVAFEARGEGVRLDAHVLGIMQNALVQLVRNAVAHGIETESERIAAGKPPVGRVMLDVVRRGSRVSFACRDDGRGIDIDAVRRAAERKGLRVQDTQKFGPDEWIRVLLRGGITTSTRVTEVSGRGVGLDVVRDTASRLGGDVHVKSEARKGATFEVVVPVSMASVDALLVQVGARTAVIALDAVRRTMRVDADDVAHTPEGDSIVFEGKMIPFAPLARWLGAEKTAPRRGWSAVVIESGANRAALGVDRLLGTENVVMRPLPHHTPADPVVAGAPLDAEGNPQIVFDPEVLVAEARRAHPETPQAPTARAPILIIDDSLTTRMLEQSILESAGYEVDVATSGEEGLRKAKERKYALFLVDVEMPGMDGFEFIQRASTAHELQNIPAILVTSRNSPKDLARGVEVGARAHIVKSDFDQTELLDRIRNLIR